MTRWIGLLWLFGAVATAESLPDWDRARTDLIARVRASTVRVVSEESPVPANFPWRAFGIPRDQIPPAQRNVGSGVAVDARHIVTTADVAGDRSIRIFTADGQRQAGRLVGRDEIANVAVIELLDQATVIPVRTDETPPLREGSWIALLGYSFAGIPILAEGVAASAPRRGVAMGDGRAYFLLGFPVPPGAAGSPIVNCQGVLVGLAAGMVDHRSLGSAGAVRSDAGSMGLAVPADRALRSAQALIRGEPIEYGWLGVTVRQVDQRVEVLRVVSESPAAEAGIVSGDVIVALDGRPVIGADDVVDRVQGTPLGYPLELRLLRGDRSLDLQVVVRARPVESAGPSRESPDQPPLEDILRRVRTERDESPRAQATPTLSQLRDQLGVLERELQRIRRLEPALNRLRRQINERLRDDEP